jgi:large subunit ribosomal protein L21
MYAVISHKSRQHQVRVGQVVNLDCESELEPGQSIVFDSVLAIGGEGEPQVGSPLLSGAKVEGKVVAQARGPKLIAFRFKRRKGVRRKRGARQEMTRVEITNISA